MFTSVGLLVLVSCFFFVGVAGIVMMTLRGTGNKRAEGSIAQVLYNAEHPEKMQ